MLPFSVPKIISYYHEAKMILREGKIPMPRMALIYPSYACGHSCPGCHYKDWNKSKKDVFIDYEDFEGLLREFKSIGVEAIEFCLLPGNKLRMNRSIKKIEDIKVGDNTLTRDSFQKVKKSYKREYDGNIANIKTGCDSRILSLTVDHLIPAVKTEKCYYEKRWFSRCKQNCSRVNCKYKKINKIEKVKAGDLTKNHFVVYPKNKKSIKVHSDMTIEFFGYYLAEGCRTASNKGIKFTIHENEIDFANRILYLGMALYKLTGKVKSRPRKGLSIEFYSKSLCTKLSSMFPGRAKEKRMPESFLDMPTSQVKILINAMVRGDGWKYQNIIAYSTASELLAIQFRELCFKANYSACLTYRKDRKPGMKEIKGLHDEYNVRFSDRPIGKGSHGWFDNDYIYIPIKEIKIKRYRGIVHNLNVVKTHDYVTSNCLVCNCGGGEPTIHPEFEALLSLIHSQGFKFGMFTNGEGITEDIAEQLVGMASYVRQSIDGEAEWDALDYLVQAKKKKDSRCLIGAKILISGLNEQTFVSLAKRALFTGVDYVQFKPAKPIYYPVKNEEVVFNEISLLKTRYANVVGGIDHTTLKGKCWLTPIHTMVDVYGDVYLCCYYQFREDSHKIGNCFGKDSFIDLWGKKKHIEAIKGIKPEECNVFDCRWHKYNVDMKEYLNSHLEFC